MTPLFSIVIPTFNRVYCLSTALESIIAQTNSDWEIIVVDDGSIDNSRSVIEQYQNQKIHYFYQENAGPSTARNLALKQVKGKWICYLDSDNELLPNYLHEMASAISNNPNALYLLPMGNRTLELYENDTMTKSIDDSSDFFPNITVKDIFLRNFHFDCNGFMHTSKIIEEGVRWDENLSLLEDWDFVMTIAKKYPDNFFYIAKILFNYHQRFGTDGLVSNANYLDWANAFEYIYQKHKNDLLLMGQEWYPARVIKYRQLETDFKSNIAPKPYLKYFVT